MSSKCIFCESSERVVVKHLPQHFRQWEINGSTFVEYMPPADDYECGDCERMWTIFDGEDDDTGESHE